MRRSHVLGVVMVVMCGACAETRRLEPRLGLAPISDDRLLDVFGGDDAAFAVTDPDHVTAFRLFPTGQQRGGPVPLDRDVAIELVRMVSSPESYVLNVHSMCLPEWGVRLRFARGATTTDMDLCFKCRQVRVTANVGGRGGSSVLLPEAFVPVTKKIFPIDPEIQQLAAR
jgi:hypothetical protein